MAWADVSLRRLLPWRAESLQGVQYRVGSRAPEPTSEALGRDIDVHLSRTLPPFYDAGLDDLQSLAAEIGEAVELHGTTSQKAQMKMVAWLIDIKRNRYTTTAHTLVLAKSLADSLAGTGTPALLFAAEGALAITYLFSEKYRERALKHLQLHRQLTKQRQELIHEVRAVWALGMWHRLMGQVEATRARALEALCLIGDKPIARWGGQAQGDLSWAAWRNGDVRTAHTMALEGPAKLAATSPRSPYEWQVRWTLLALALSAGDVADAATHAHAMLDTTQQKPSDQVETALGNLLDDCGRGRLAEATTATVLDAARAGGYL